MENTFIYFNSKFNLIRLDIANVVFFKADGNYTHIITKNKQSYMISINLSHMEDALFFQLGKRSSVFMRLGKSFIINRSFITHVNLSKQLLELSDQTNFSFQLPISKEALKQVKNIMLNYKM